MDLIKYIADFIPYMFDEDENGKRPRAEPETSYADRYPEGFTVKSTSFWTRPMHREDMIENQFLSEDSIHTMPTQIFDHVLPIRVVWHSRSNGELWRAFVQQQTWINSMAFFWPFYVPGIAKGPITKATLAKAAQGANGIEFKNPEKMGQGLFYRVDLGPDNSSDVFRKVEIEGKTNGYRAEQHFIGQVTFTGGAKLPPHLRNLL